MTKLIPLTQGKYALVDDDMFDLLSTVKWTFSKTTGAYRQICGEPDLSIRRKSGPRSDWYKMKRHKRKGQRMSWVVMANEKLLAESLNVGFINGNILDLRKENLRILSPAQRNAASRKQNRDLTSKYKGVCFDKSRNKWRAEIKTPDRIMHLGRYDTEELAALAYNAAAIKAYGEYAFINDIQATVFTEKSRPHHFSK